MKRTALALALIAAAAPAMAAPLSCRVEESTDRHFCYDPKGIRANGEVRAFKLYQGGPKGVEGNPYEARFYCELGVLELRDRKGVVFARDQPTKLHIVQLRGDVCAEKGAKPDKTLKEPGK